MEFDERFAGEDLGQRMLIEFCGLPGTGKTTLSRLVAADTGGILLRVDAIEAALQRHGLVPGAAGYAVAHDLAEAHLRRGFAVIVDAVSPVAAARAGWRDLARACGVPHRVIETRCEPGEHRRRVTDRRADIPGLVYPTWDEVMAREYEPRTDDRLVVDTARPVSDCLADIADYLRKP